MLGCASIDILDSLAEAVAKKHTHTKSQNPTRELVNDTIINVSQLLHNEKTGSTRTFQLQLDSFDLDDDLPAIDISGEIRLLRTSESIIATGKIRGIAMVECVRCLNIYEQPFETEIEQEYRLQLDIIDQAMAGEIEPDPYQEIGEIDEFNQIDLAEPIRQFAILALPMRPVCGPDCPGPAIDTTDDDGVDPRLSALEELLEDQPEGFEQ